MLFIFIVKFCLERTFKEADGNVFWARDSMTFLNFWFWGNYFYVCLQCFSLSWFGFYLLQAEGGGWVWCFVPSQQLRLHHGRATSPANRWHLQRIASRQPCKQMALAENCKQEAKDRMNEQLQIFCIMHHSPLLPPQKKNNKKSDKQTRLFHFCVWCCSWITSRGRWEQQRMASGKPLEFVITEASVISPLAERYTNSPSCACAE